MNTNTVTIVEALNDARVTLDGISDSAQLEAEILLSYVLDCNRAYLHTWPEQLLTPVQQDLFRQFINRRSNGEPVAYITGLREFWEMSLRVTPDTLIPRPETEHLVELALEKIPQDAKWNIADLGTGSGAIALAIAHERPHCQVFAIDKSAKALAVAQENARRLNIRNVTFIEGCWLEPIIEVQFEIMVSNPPYVHPEDPHLTQGDLRFEPSVALQSAPDGLTDIRTIAKHAREYLHPGGWLILEHGYDQGPTIKDLLGELGYQDVSTIEDLSHNERICCGKWDGGA